MKATSFENLVISGDACKRFFDFTMKTIVIFIIIMIIITVISRFTSFKIHIPIMWYINIPKIYFSLMAVIFVFFYDYTTKTIQIPKFDDMLMSTFLVGILAIIELLTGIATIIKDVCDMFNED